METAKNEGYILIRAIHDPLAFRILINMHVLSVFRTYVKMMTPKAALLSLSGHYH
jgi:hypothetical protein